MLNRPKFKPYLLHLATGYCPRRQNAEEPISPEFSKPLSLSCSLEPKAGSLEAPIQGWTRRARDVDGVPWDLPFWWRGSQRAGEEAVALTWSLGRCCQLKEGVCARGLLEQSRRCLRSRLRSWGTPSGLPPPFLRQILPNSEWEPEAQEADTERGKETTLLKAGFTLAPSVLQPGMAVCIPEGRKQRPESRRALEPGGNFQTSPGPAAYLSSSSPTSPRQQSSKLSLQGARNFIPMLQVRTRRLKEDERLAYGDRASQRQSQARRLSYRASGGSSASVAGLWSPSRGYRPAGVPCSL
ncbi:uncharacterized protein LOC122685742 isoform X2 [Cervus elaphus]|uniref:uncharacterized protein LOC122685742 isoform X2 n=1 Tax=Cervus elaphus TaxID=9860 RepID=UPI001CC2A7C7|nr:uncharacterized protein LOC122685742 isoform X2 [Cervus elaphus]